MEQAPSQHGSEQSRRHMRVLAGCVALVAGMGGLAYASVPLYELFCQVTGYGGTTRRVENAGVQLSDKTGDGALRCQCFRWP